jgi:uncharacterized protein YqgC (DUF456 family)
MMHRMEWLHWIVATLFFLLGAGCVISVIFSLPGAWVMLALAALIEWLDTTYLPAERSETFGWWVLGICLAVAIIGEIIEFAAGALGAKKGGASKRGMIGALIGGIIGVFVFTPLFFFVPIVGSLCGAILGTFVGALIAELSRENATMRGTMKPALGATIGRVLGTAGKMAVAVAIWLTLSVAAFWP